MPINITDGKDGFKPDFISCPHPRPPKADHDEAGWFDLTGAYFIDKTGEKSLTPEKRRLLDQRFQ
jgi:hypothetical protein